MDITLTIRDGKPTATSVQIAAHFEKRHDNILRDIRDLIEGLNTTPEGEEFNLLNFQEIPITDSRGRTHSAYALTRDAFTLLAMGFTGEKALHFKMAYIAAFNRMEAELNGQRLPALLPDVFKPECVFTGDAGSVAWRFAFSLAHAMDKMREDIQSGRAYMLPEGVAQITFPDKLFYGWYTDSTLRIPSAMAHKLGIRPAYLPGRVTPDPRNGFVSIDLMAF